jgi:multiple sugar transport system permease protein
LQNRLSREGRINRLLKEVFSYALLIFLSSLCLFIFYIMLVNSARYNPEIRRGFSILPGKAFAFNFQNLVKDSSLVIFTGLKNSFIISTGVAVLATYFSALTAYGIHMYRFRGRKFFFVFILLLMMVPTQVSTMGFVKLMRDVRLDNSFIPFIIPAISSPIIFFFMKQYLDSTLPFEIVESARIDGASEIRIFHQIVLPILRPAIAVQAIFAFVGSYNNYFVPALLLTNTEKKTVPILIAMLRSMDYQTDLGLIYMMTTIGIVPLVIIYLILSRHIIKGVTFGSVKG